MRVERVVYADSSALVKLVLDEPESDDLEAYVEATGAQLGTSRLAVVEVARALRVGNASLEAQTKAADLLEESVLVDVGEPLLQAAAAIASRELRTLDAIHLATIEFIDPDEVLVYDRRLRESVREAGFTTVSPGAEG